MGEEVSQIVVVNCRRLGVVQELVQRSRAAVTLQGVPKAVFVVEIRKVEEIAVVAALQNKLDLLRKYLAAANA